MYTVKNSLRELQQLFSSKKPLTKKDRARGLELVTAILILYRITQKQADSFNAIKSVLLDSDDKEIALDSSLGCMPTIPDEIALWW